MRFRVLGFALLVAGVAFGQSITATKAYVDRRYTEATNAVASIVTNETTVGWRWELHPDFVSATDPVFEAWYLPDGSFGGASWSAVFTMRDGYQMPGDVPAGESDGGRDVVPFYQGTAYRIKGNALGLAMVKDLEKLPTREMVTNVARAVSNSFWDERNEVLWRLEFRDGEPMFVPITNENVKATGGVL